MAAAVRFLGGELWTLLHYRVIEPFFQPWVSWPGLPKSPVDRRAKWKALPRPGVGEGKLPEDAGAAPLITLPGTLALSGDSLNGGWASPLYLPNDLHIAQRVQDINPRSCNIPHGSIGGKLPVKDGGFRNNVIHNMGVNPYFII